MTSHSNHGASPTRADTGPTSIVACGRCKGAGFSPIGDGSEACPECYGRGFFEVDGSEIDDLDILDEVLGQLHDIEAQLADLARRKKALREVLMQQVDAAGGASLERPMATIKVVPGYERVSYDRRGLDRLAASQPEVGRLLAAHRKVSEVGPSVRVAWRGKARP